MIKTSSIDQFAASVNLSPGEAWEVYRQIKDLVIDSEVMGMISSLHRYDYVYWRSEYPINLFMSQLQGNLLKKLSEYSKYGTNHILLSQL